MRDDDTSMNHTEFCHLTPVPAPPSKEFHFFHTREKIPPEERVEIVVERTLISPLRIEEQDLSTRDLRCSSLLGLKVVIRLKFFVEFTEDWNIVLLKSKIE